MEPVGVQLAPVISDGLYELPGHSSSYPYTSSFWGPREERLYPAPTSQNINTVIRHTEPLRNSNVDQKVLGTEIIPEEEQDVTDWNCETEHKEQDTSQSEQGTQKQSQVACTLKWLTENYERAEGVCLPRCVLYTHYLDFCKKMKYTPAGAATFGKIIRQKFPKLTTRRLGTRGQSKYHYYGIGIKESSIYYHSVYSGKGLTRFSGIKIKTEGSNRKYSLSSKTGTLLPEFPNADNLILPENIEREKMKTFIMMYRTHCQRILDTIISANFDEVQNFLLHFWQGMPEHLLELLNIEMVADIVALCDSILYKVLVDVLIPSTIQDLPESLGSEINIFLKKLPHWLHSSLENVCEAIRNRKVQVMKTFIQSIRRQISFVHLAQTTRSVLLNHETLNQMIEDVADVDFSEICCQASFMETKSTEFRTTISEMYDEFQNLLSKQAPVEGYTEWLDNIIDKCVLQPTKDKGKSFKEKASEFLLQWEMFGSFFMRDLTLHSASSFGSFHLIRMTFDEYVFLVMETQQDHLKEVNLQKNVQKYMKNAEEIKMQAKVRMPSTKHQNSPKSKKRKLTDDQYDSNDEAEGCLRVSDENRPSMTDSYTSLNGTAFSRPLPSANRDPCGHAFSDDSCRTNLGHSSLPLSPLKHYPSLNSSSYDRPTYLPQYGLNGLNSYSDLMSASNSLSAPRVQNYTDSHLQSFPTVPFTNSVAQTAGTYWTDNRTHPSFHDPYNPYSYNKFHSSYDTYNKSSILRSGSYPDAFNRSAFDTSRPYYRGAHDNFQVGSHLPMSGFNSNYMDIAQPPSQYGRQDSVFYQDDLYSSPMASSFSSLGKPYLAATFR